MLARLSIENSLLTSTSEPFFDVITIVICLDLLSFDAVMLIVKNSPVFLFRSEF